MEWNYFGANIRYEARRALAGGVRARSAPARRDRSAQVRRDLFLLDTLCRERHPTPTLPDSFERHDLPPAPSGTESRGTKAGARHYPISAPEHNRLVHELIRINKRLGKGAWGLESNPVGAEIKTVKTKSACPPRAAVAWHRLVHSHHVMESGPKTGGEPGVVADVPRASTFHPTRAGKCRLDGRGGRRRPQQARTRRAQPPPTPSDLHLLDEMFSATSQGICHTPSFGQSSDVEVVEEPTDSIIRHTTRRRRSSGSTPARPAGAGQETASFVATVKKSHWDAKADATNLLNFR